MLSFTAFSFLFSQEFEVRSFTKDPKDISAIRFPRKDVNNQAAAIIKVRTNMTGLKFDCNSGFIGDPEVKEGEIWLYVSPRERRLKFINEDFISKDYVIEEVIEPSTVYILELVNKFQTPVKTGTSMGFVLIKSDPPGAKVMVNGESKGETPFNEILPYGSYSIRLINDEYYEIDTIITIEKDEHDITIKLHRMPYATKGVFIDQRDGKQYRYITIGDQVWMAENLNYLTNETWCYNNKKRNCKTFGRLYSWEAARYACPEGFHLPSDKEWDQLVIFLGGESVAGGKLKEAGTNHWISPNSWAGNSSGFSALPSGVRNINGKFVNLGKKTSFMTSTGSSSTFFGPAIYSSITMMCSELNTLKPPEGRSVVF